MPFDAKTLSSTLNNRRSRSVRREADIVALRNEISLALPEAAKILSELQLTAVDIARAALSRMPALDPDGALPPSATPNERLAALRLRTETRRNELRELLTSAGYSHDALETGYNCNACRDSGYTAPGVPCSCLISDYCEAQLDELSELLPVRTQTFDTFSLALFDGERRIQMEAYADGCRKFARNIDGAKRSLLLSGPPGTGKTFLASCIAAEMSALGRSVQYISATALFALCERAKFTYSEETAATTDEQIKRLMDADLLIIDDLGSEFKSPYANTALLSILDGRLRSGKKLLICTTLDVAAEGPNDELTRRYTPQIASRLRGDFAAFRLSGGDLRRAEL